MAIIYIVCLNVLLNDRERTILMKAIQYRRPGKFSCLDVSSVRPGPGEVAIAVHYAGICGTDLHIMSEESPAAAKVVLGHEFSGEVIETGEGVENLQNGDRVAVDPNNHCGWCDYCRRGHYHFCRNLKPIGVFRNGAWAENCVAPASQVYLLPNGISLAWGALAEPLSCIVHGLDRLGTLNAANRILIMGAGIVGILWGLTLRHLGQTNILFSEPQVIRREILSGLGFDVVPPEHIESLPADEQALDIIIDCSGYPPAIEQAFEWLIPLGKLLLFGVCPIQSKIEINPFQIFKKELTLIGSVINPLTFSRAIELMAEIQIPIEKLGVRFFELEDYAMAIEAAKSGDTPKVMFTPNTAIGKR
jgi:D-arabinitol dehydrogenase (NADP+)